MIDELRFIAGAVAKKDYVEELTHVRIRNGWIQSFNGTISAACKIALDLDVMPEASDLLSAIRACDETVALSVTKTGRLSIRSGKFKCFVNCLDASNETLQSFPRPEGAFVEVTSEFMNALRALAPFMATDASRPWAVGIIISGVSAYATNNVMLAQYWHGINFDLNVTIPAEAVNELLRRKEEPTHVQVSENSLTVWFGQDKWFRTQLLIDAYPEKLPKALEVPGDTPIPIENYKGLFEALEKLRPFLSDSKAIVFRENEISTSYEDDDEGATIEVPNIPAGQCYNHEHLTLLKQGVATVDFSPYPAPARFFGGNKRMRGIFMGMHRQSNAG